MVGAGGYFYAPTSLMDSESLSPIEIGSSHEMDKCTHSILENWFPYGSRLIGLLWAWTLVGMGLSLHHQERLEHVF